MAALALSACGGDGDGDSDSLPLPAEAALAAKPQPHPVTFTKGLVHPWSLAFLPDGSMLVTERPGRLRHVSASGKKLSAPITGVPAVFAEGQGGLLDVVLDPDFSSNRRIYLSYAEASAGLAGTAVARAVLSKDLRSLGSLRVIFRQLPKEASVVQFGGRLVFARDGTLFVTLGDRLEGDGAQDLRGYLGKVVRITTSGKAPLDNPYRKTTGAAAAIWSLGHRNPQGAALHPGTGELWINEHGPQGGDEVNIVRAKRNYGWPRVSYGCDYGTPPDTCTPVGGATSGKGYVQPLTYWVPSIAPSGLAFYTGDVFPAWKGNLFLGALRGEALWRLVLSGNKVVRREALFTSLGERIRDVRQGPDGLLYLLTDNDAGRIIRIVP